MSISSTTRKAGPYNGNGATVAFPFAFKVFGVDDVVVVKTSAAGVESTLARTTDYTVSLNVDQDVSPGGTVTCLVAPATGELLTLTSAVAGVQPVDLTNMGGYYPAVINAALDRLTILFQQVSEEVGRAVKTGISSGVDPATLVNTLIANATAAVASASSAASSASTASTAAGTIAGFENKGAWLTGTAYAKNNLVQDSGNTYICLVAHTSGTLNTDIGAGKWAIFAQKGTAGAGSGDVVAANNLSEYTATAAIARANLGLGAAAVKAVGGSNVADVPTNADVRGKQTISIPAGALRPRLETGKGASALATTTGTTGQPDVPYLAFDPATPQYAGIVVAMPKSWDLGNVTASFQWRRAAGTAGGNCVWGMRAVAIQDNVNPAANFGAEATVIDAASVTTANFNLSGETGNCTVGGTPTALNLVFFEFFRKADDAVNDTLADASWLSSVRLHYNTNANTDA